MKALKIGFVLDDSLDRTDGVQQYVLALGRWLAAQGHEVHYLVSQTERRDLANLHVLSRSVRTHFSGNRGTTPLPASTRQIKRLLSSVHFDVLHVQVPFSPLLAGRVVKRAAPDTAVVGTFHIMPYSPLVTLSNYALGAWLRPTLRRFDAMLSVSSAAAKFASQAYRLDSRVVPNVVDYERFRAAKPLPAFTGKKLNILFLGRLVERKGCLVLLQALDKLLASQTDLPDFRVLICGRGPLEPALMQFAACHELGQYVEFLGYVPEVEKPRYLASADIAVFPSKSGESFGIVLVEAMAAGRAAVLAGDNPGYRSVMRPRPDLLFPPTSSEVLAKKLEYFMKDRASRRTAAEWGKRYAETFDTSVVGAKILKVYQRALLKRRRSGIIAA